MSTFQLVRVHGQQREEIWPLPSDQPSRVGRYDRDQSAPDIDLWPDRKVSRRHASLWQEKGQWWCKDEGSKHGTCINGQQLPPHTNTQLAPGSEICMGESVFLFASPRWHRLKSRDGSLIVELEASPSLNYSLAHCELPILSQIVLRNWGKQATPPGAFTITIGEYGATETIPLSTLQPQESRAVRIPAWHWNTQALEKRLERANSVVAVKLDGQPLPGARIDCWVLAHNEWSQAPEHWGCTAAFVLPNHPLVVQIADEAIHHLGPDVEPTTVLKALYEYLASTWNVRYVYEPPSWETLSQKVRFPHHVFVDPANKRGQGTCIDLSLLLAACLEHLGCQPLLAFVDMGEWKHALVGCWRQSRASLESVTVDRERLLARAVWVESLGCTQDPRYRTDFAAACRAAEAHLRERPLVFGLDIASARANDRIRPLPFAGEPTHSEAVGLILQQATAVARATGQPLGTVPMLMGLLSVGGGMLPQVCEQWGVQPEHAVQRLEAGLRCVKRIEGEETSTTQHYDHMVTHAHALAKREGSPLILEQHLLQALLETPSEALDKALTAIGIDRATAFQRIHGGHSATSVFSQFPSQF